MKQGMFLAFGLLASAASYGSAITVDTTPVALHDEDQTQVRAQIDHALRAGDYDTAGILWPVMRGGVKHLLSLTSTWYQTLTTSQKNQIIESLAQYRNEFLARTYRVTVNADTENLASQTALTRLGINPADLHGPVEAEDLLSPFARRWAYQMSEFSGPNCWHSSMASIFLGWERARHMTAREFECHVEHSFTQLQPQSLTELEYGDLIRLTYRNGSEVHGFTFLGPDRTNSDRIIVFTKNGMARSRYVYMDLETVWEDFYPNTVISYYRPHRSPVDPSNGEETECSQFANTGAPLVSEPDPLIMAAYRADGGQSLAVLVGIDTP